MTRLNVSVRKHYKESRSFVRNRIILKEIGIFLLVERFFTVACLQVKKQWYMKIRKITYALKETRIRVKYDKVFTVSICTHLTDSSKVQYSQRRGMTLALSQY